MLTLVHSAIDVGSVFAFEVPERVQPPKGVPVSVLESAATKPEYSAFTEPGSSANLGLIVVVGTWFSWIAAIIEVIIAAVTPLSVGQRVGILILAVANALSASVVRILGHRLKLFGIHMWGAIGTVIITVGVYYSGNYIDVFPLVYGWVPMVAFALWNRRPALLHVAIVMVCYAAVLNLRPFHQRASLWLIIMTIVCFNAAVVTVLTDRLRNLVITEQLARRTAERVRAELATTTGHKSDFLANMSHELRTPLNAIVGFADLLHGEIGGPLNPRQQAYVEDIRSAASRLTSIINDVLDLAKLEAHRFQIDVELVALAPMFDRVLARARGEAAGQVEITGYVEPDLEFITADASRIEQVLTNLAINGVKFTPAGGRVSLTARQDGSNVAIDVTDTGIGILPEQQARIFDPFHQGTRMIGDRLPEGTGLGLTLAKNLIELHGGRITLRSEPDHGSTFTIDLPIRPPAPRTAALATTPHPMTPIHLTPGGAL
jgi:signal transduction histidine kinase